MALLSGDDPSILELTDWKFVRRALHVRFQTGSFASGVQLCDRIGAVADELDHHPDVDLRYASVAVRTFSHDTGGVTSRDVALARRISEIAAELGVAAAPPQTTVIEIAVDAARPDVVRPFWRAVLGLQDDPHIAGDLVDPHGQLPSVWFQLMQPPRAERNRIHIDICVPADVAEQRVSDALAAGGHLVSVEDVPSFWVLADPEGNEVCVCTWQEKAADD